MKISIIIPVYNTEAYIERCVHSCTGQTFSDLEIIIVDDGSTDSTPGIVDDLASKDSRIRVIHKPNGGSSSARNAGIKTAGGDYLGFVDADDYIEPDMYEILADAVRAHDLKIAQTGRDELSENGEKLPPVVIPPDEYTESTPEDIMKELLLHRGDCSFCTKLVKRELFDTALFPEDELNEDFRLYTELLQEVDRIGILPDAGYHVCYRQGSNTRTARNEFSRVFTDIVVNADRMEELIPVKYPGLEAYAARFGLVQRLDYMMHIPVEMMNDDNEFYTGVKKYLREHRDDIKNNPYLDEDRRHKLKLMAAAPKFIRSVHRLSMKLRGVY